MYGQKNKKMSNTNTPEELEHNLPFDPPSLEFVMNATKPLYAYFTPEFIGMEKVDPDKPTLFVHNHSVLGIFDGQMLGAELYKEKGIFMRSLVDNAHYEVPVWRDMVTMIGGGVRGTRKNCAELMRQKEHILVFPGGGREVCKQKGEKYKLTWKNRTGFARMAMEFGYQIIPVACIGADDAYEVLIDSNDIMDSKLGDWLKKSGIAQKFLKNGEHIPPITRGIGPTLLPKPQKFYYAFGDPIETKDLMDKYEDKDVQMQIRKEVELSMNQLFVELMEKRDAEFEEMSPLRRFLNRL